METDRAQADQWMHQNKRLLPGPLTAGDWEQIRELLATYGQSEYARGQRDAREDAAKACDGRFVEHLQFGEIAYCADLAEVIRALPLRGKQGTDGN